MLGKARQKPCAYQTENITITAIAISTSFLHQCWLDYMERRSERPMNTATRTFASIYDFQEIPNCPVFSFFTVSFHHTSLATRTVGHLHLHSVGSGRLSFVGIVGHSLFLLGGWYTSTLVPQKQSSSGLPDTAPHFGHCFSTPFLLYLPTS